MIAAREDCDEQTVLTTRATAPAVVLVLLDDIWSSDRVLKLRQAVQAELYWEEGHWTCEMSSLRIMGFGDTQEQAIGDFCEDFCVTYDGLVNEEDDSLTADAKLAKHTLQRFVQADVPARATLPGLVGMSY